VNRILSITLLVAYLGTLLSTLAPLLYYITYQDYILQNLCENRNKIDLECNGKCYMNEQLSKATKKSNKENRIKLEKFPELYSLVELPTLCKYSQFKIVISYLSNLHSSDFRNDIFHPPTIN